MFNKILEIILDLLGIRIKNNDNNNRQDIKYFYSKKPLMTNYELSFYDKIKELESEYIIIPQLNLASVIKKNGKFKYQSELYRNIDFAIFSKNYKNLLLLIEINDKTHNTKNRIDRDLKVKKICNDVNIELINFYTNYPNEKEYVINRIKKHIEQDKN